MICDSKGRIVLVYWCGGGDFNLWKFLEFDEFYNIKITL